MLGIWLLTHEEIFITFKLINGSGWLTSHRLVMCEHEPDHLKGKGEWVK
jgi:hypothetical protein